MGPMRAACRFARELGSRVQLDRVVRVQVELYGSLALTGLGHATDRAVILGLAGNEPATIDPAAIESTVAAIRSARRIDLAGKHSIPFEEPRDLIFDRSIMFPPGANIQHPNGLRLKAYDAAGAVIDERTFFSIGGGFITEDVASDVSDSAGKINRDAGSARHPVSVSQRGGIAGHGKRAMSSPSASSCLRTNAL